MKKPFVRIGEDGSTSIIDGDRLAALQEAVGGWITTAPITRNGMIPGNTTAYANDEGLILGLSYNSLASDVCGYKLFGPVVIRATAKVRELLVPAAQ